MNRPVLVYTVCLTVRPADFVESSSLNHLKPAVNIGLKNCDWFEQNIRKSESNLLMSSMNSVTYIKGGYNLLTWLRSQDFSAYCEEKSYEGWPISALISNPFGTSCPRTRSFSLAYSPSVK